MFLDLICYRLTTQCSILCSFSVFSCSLDPGAMVASTVASGHGSFLKYYLGRMDVKLKPFNIMHLFQFGSIVYFSKWDESHLPLTWKHHCGENNEFWFLFIFSAVDQ